MNFSSESTTTPPSDTCPCEADNTSQWFDPCPENYKFYPHTSKCYQAVWNSPDGEVTRSDANAACTAAGGYLPSVHDKETNCFLTCMISIRSYIGGVYIDGNWTWTDGSAWDYENWRPGDPDTPIASVPYVEIYNSETGVWHNEDNVIGYSNGYICQIQPIIKADDLKKTISELESYITTNGNGANTTELQNILQMFKDMKDALSSNTNTRDSSLIHCELHNKCLG